MSIKVSCPPVTPRDYLYLVVLKNYEIYEEKYQRWFEKSGLSDFDSTSEAGHTLVCSAINSAITAYHLHEWIFHHYKDDPNESHKLFYKTSLREYRKYLNEVKCIYAGHTAVTANDFYLIGDIANTYKHFNLTRSSRCISGHRNIDIRGTYFGELPLGEGSWGGYPELIINLDNGEKRAFSMILNNVIAMWKELDAQNLV